MRQTPSDRPRCASGERTDLKIVEVIHTGSISLTQHHILPLYTSQHPQDRPTLQTTTTKTTAKMTIPLSTISTFRTTFNPFLRSARPCRLILSLLRNPTTTPASSPGHIDIKVTQLPRSSTQEPELTIGFKNGKELKIEVGKRQMKIGDVVEEIARVGRAIEREEALKS
ncbi:hypothetical protein CBS63078_1665 [Aspergillus niger]|nr:hypothetical protein CBS115989_3541 [Aspergillus niger]KAI2833094.1 hypothetical protein CBS133816_932 [Aspergillus niger]KAI2842137.1 hypothetical protein CBS11350_6056 [Aspergillus niger]KAI2860931.1 hypothetical protein CBS11232_1174 [Aspergillus niger]KAI2864466.1 hypothetical protein CBS12448_2959 [Aspergillus niger]